jgi:prepilin-type N-terminal cleavage/methylation domain-containing protein
MRFRGKRPACAGFSLLEVLLSLAIVALILVALNTFVFSMAELWGRNGDVRLFDKHVNAVTRFLSEEMKAATFPPAAIANSTPVAPQSISPENGLAGNLITFELPAGSRLLSWPDRPLPEVVCSLQARDGDGLFLLWHSRLETRFSDDPPRETLISPLVTRLSYDYYDDNFKRWTTETTLRIDSGGQPEAPQRLRLTFAYRKLARETTVTLPATIPALPNF